MRLVAGLLGFVAAATLVACSGSNDSIEALGGPCSPLLYEGEGKPDAIVVSDLPLRGQFRPATAPMVAAITHVLRGSGFRAGELRVGYQSCDYSVGGEWDEARCAQNARRYVANRSVLGVIGSYHSGCASVQLPILSRRGAGPLGMISPANTYIGLTRDGPGTDGQGPARFYPDDLRNYVRLAPPDDAQGAAGAIVARDGGARSVVALIRSRDVYSESTGGSFVRAARSLGLAATSLVWEEQDEYRQLARQVARARPDAVYLAGGSIANGKQLVGDLRSALGRELPILAADGWAGLATDLGAVGEGLLVTSSGVPAELLPPRGRELIRAIGGSAPRGRAYTAEAGQAADVLLDAISRSDGTRASVVEELFETRVRGGIIGDFAFDAGGDIDPAFFGLYRFTGGEDRLVRLVRARSELVHAQR